MRFYEEGKFRVEVVQDRKGGRRSHDGEEGLVCLAGQANLEGCPLKEQKVSEEVVISRSMKTYLVQDKSLAL